MGSWGTRTFENDLALDWLDTFAATPSSARLREALSPDGLARGADEGSVALAAAEVVAAWCGRPAPEIPPPVTAWLLGRTEGVTEEILETARTVVETVLADSELRELWEEAGELEAWRGALEDLRRRLGE